MNFSNSFFSFALEKHSDQRRKNSGLPYFVHITDVLKVIGSEWNINDEILWHVAIGHDLLEDTDTTEIEIERFCGTKVVETIKELTFFETCSKSDYMSSFHDKSVEALIVKLADRLANIRDFIDARDRYAAKYFLKASVLLECLTSRSEEIGQRIGSKSYLKMVLSYSRLKEELINLH